MSDALKKAEKQRVLKEMFSDIMKNNGYALKVETIEGGMTDMAFTTITFPNGEVLEIEGDLLIGAEEV